MEQNFKFPTIPRINGKKRSGMYGKYRNKLLYINEEKPVHKWVFATYIKSFCRNVFFTVDSLKFGFNIIQICLQKQGYMQMRNLNVHIFRSKRTKIFSYWLLSQRLYFTSSDQPVFFEVAAVPYKIFWCEWIFCCSHFPIVLSHFMFSQVGSVNTEQTQMGLGKEAYSDTIGKLPKPRDCLNIF